MPHRGMLGRAGRSLRLGLLRLRPMLVALMLREGGSRARRQQSEQNASHAAAPSSGRTVTTRIMPACMW
jgi:hypothetical protein